VLGLGFTLDDAAPVAPTLDVILSQTQTPLTPEQADFLAAANSRAAATPRRPSGPGTTQAGWVPQAQAGLAPQPLRAQSPDAAPPPETRVVTSTGGEAAVPPAPRRARRPIPRSRTRAT
jgi:protein TonB